MTVMTKVFEDQDTSLSRYLLEATDPNKEKDLWLRRYKRENISNVMRGIRKIQLAEEHGLSVMVGILRMKHFLNNGDEVDYGIVSTRVVTTVGVGFIVDAFQNIVELESMRYHGIGTTNTAEAVGDTALAAELSTVYNPDNTRATGTLGESSANVYRTVGTNVVDGSATIVEHGIFSQAATGGGVLLDRSIFGGIALVNGNSLQSTYDFTITAGS